MNAIASFNLWEACMQTHSRQNGFPLPSIRGNAHRSHGEEHNFEVPAIQNDPPAQSNKETCATDLIQTFHKPAHHIHNSFHFAFVQAQHTLFAYGFKLCQWMPRKSFHSVLLETSNTCTLQDMKESHLRSNTSQTLTLPYSIHNTGFLVELSINLKITSQWMNTLWTRSNEFTQHL